MALLGWLFGKRRPAPVEAEPTPDGIFGFEPEDGREGEVADFVDMGYPVFNNRLSATEEGEFSRIRFVQYIKKTQTLMVEFQDGRAWLYDPINPEQAESFIKAPSLGIWMWDHIWIRGRGNFGKHQCNARRIK